MLKFAFVILNYLTSEETEKCVLSIQKKCSDVDYKIYIVDNCSPNKSGEYLKEKYHNDDKIETIICDENLGFARGNNVGFIKAKTEYHADFIILCNSDTEIITDNFCNLIADKYALEKYAVLGPKELLPDGTIYPLNNNFPTIDFVKHNIKNLERELRANNCFFYSVGYNSIKSLKTIIRKTLKKSSSYSALDTSFEYRDLVLHGFFLIFSKQYIDCFDGLDNRTFFYGEEDLLSIRLKKSGLHSLYCPSLEVLHNRNGATNAKCKKLKDKNNFVLSNKIKSLKIVLDELSSN